VVGRLKEKEQMWRGTRNVRRRNRCAGGWKRKRKGTEMKGNERCHVIRKNRYVCD
jgi:hypothetical protein